MDAIDTVFDPLRVFAKESFASSRGATSPIAKVLICKVQGRGSIHVIQWYTLLSVFLFLSAYVFFCIWYHYYLQMCFTDLLYYVSELHLLVVLIYSSGIECPISKVYL